MNNVVSHSNGKVEWFEDHVRGYEEDKKRRLGVDELTPIRTKHKKLTR